MEERDGILAQILSLAEFCETSVLDEFLWFVASDV